MKGEQLAMENEFAHEASLGGLKSSKVTCHKPTGEVTSTRHGE